MSVPECVGPSASPGIVVTVSVLTLSTHLKCRERTPGHRCGLVNLCYPIAERLKYQLEPVSDVGTIQQTKENCSNKFRTTGEMAT